MTRVGERVLVHKVSGAFPGYHEPVLFQLLVGERDRCHAHFELRRQLADGRKRMTQRVLPIDDPDRNLAPDLLLEALLGLAVDRDHVFIHLRASHRPCGANGGGGAPTTPGSGPLGTLDGTRTPDTPRLHTPRLPPSTDARGWPSTASAGSRPPSRSSGLSASRASFFLPHIGAPSVRIGLTVPGRRLRRRHAAASRFP